jgi:hypothetical protein
MRSEKNSLRNMVKDIRDRVGRDKVDNLQFTGREISVSQKGFWDRQNWEGPGIAMSLVEFDFSK